MLNIIIQSLVLNCPVDDDDDDKPHLLPRGRVRTQQCSLPHALSLHGGNILHRRGLLRGVASGSLVLWLVVSECELPGSADTRNLTVGSAV